MNPYILEDAPYGDITAELLLNPEVRCKSQIISKEYAVVAGLTESAEIFKEFGLKVQQLVDEGTYIEPHTPVMTIEGTGRSILLCERTALNFIMHLSGIATETYEVVTSARKVNPSIVITATRKTIPGLRIAEKHAVQLGGGDTHRLSLSDMILVKDNHIRLVGSIEKVLAILKTKKPFTKKVEIEVQNQSEAILAAKSGLVDIIMLDNFKPNRIKKIYTKLKKINPKIIIEVSGGITRDNIQNYARYADIISLSAITLSARARDFSLEIIEVNQ